MNESQLQKIHNYKIYPRDSIRSTHKRFVNIDYGRILNGSHWTFFMVKNNKSYYFDWFVGAPENILLKQPPKSIIYHNYKIQDINSKLCDPFCFYIFNLIERMNY